jgi:alginate O-acetyltransferase complex protein AlgI
MNVTSLSFFAFTALVWFAVKILPGNRARQVLLLLASYAFYATFGWGFLILLIASSLTNYFFGRQLRRSPSPWLLWASVATNCLLLGFFKYVPQLVTGSGSSLFARLVMPVGISFWTFQALSYVFDMYRGEDLNPSLVEFCLYMAFWPTVLSGPITRLPEMLPQFRSIPNVRQSDISVGLQRIVVGLFLKVVLAQLLATGIRPGEGVDFGFDGATTHWGGVDVWFLALGYGLQLYFDFAGYSHIVIGVARLFGFELPENFSHPYLSRTPSEFWTRWHMSLSFWIRDYLFLPLATLRTNMAWRYLSLVIAMTAFGLWHGFTWTYLLWGCYNGCLLVVHRVLQTARRRFAGRVAGEDYLSWALTFMAILLGWILFRARDLSQAVAMLSSVMSPKGYLHLSLLPNYYLLTLAMVAAYFSFAGLSELVSRSRSLRWIGTALSPLYYAAALILVIIFSSQKSVFVYFQF